MKEIYILDLQKFRIIVHEKMRQFIIVIEKYTKNDGNQNFNGFNKVHENHFLKAGIS